MENRTISALPKTYYTGENSQTKFRLKSNFWEEYQNKGEMHIHALQFDFTHMKFQENYRSRMDKKYYRGSLLQQTSLHCPIVELYFM